MASGKTCRLVRAGMWKSLPLLQVVAGRRLCQAAGIPGSASLATARSRIVDPSSGRWWPPGSRRLPRAELIKSLCARIVRLSQTPSSLPAVCGLGRGPQAEPFDS